MAAGERKLVCMKGREEEKEGSYPWHVIIIQAEDMDVKGVVWNGGDVDDCVGSITSIVPQEDTSIAVTGVKG